MMTALLRPTHIYAFPARVIVVAVVVRAHHCGGVIIARSVRSFTRIQRDNLRLRRRQQSQSRGGVGGVLCFFFHGPPLRFLDVAALRPVLAVRPTTPRLVRRLD